MDLERYLKRPEQKFDQALSIVIDRLYAAIERMDAEGISSNELLFNRNFCAATHYYLQRLRNSYAEGNIDLLAWTTRNLFELTVKLKYYRYGPDGVDVFLLERDVDHIELHTGLLEWIKATHPDPDSPAMQALANIETPQSRGIKTPPRPTVRAMAEKAGMLQEYDGFYKFHSKYVHPTSWLVNGSGEQVERDGYREVLTLQAFNYGNELAVLLQVMPT